MVGWSGRVIAALMEYKRLGIFDFPTAWDLALDECPPGGRDAGPRARALFKEDDDAGQDEPLVDFVHRVAADAWEGRRPVLRYLKDAQILGYRESTPTGGRKARA